MAPSLQSPEGTVATMQGEVRILKGPRLTSTINITYQVHY